MFWSHLWHYCFHRRILPSLFLLKSMTLEAFQANLSCTSSVHTNFLQGRQARLCKALPKCIQCSRCRYNDYKGCPWWFQVLDSNGIEYMYILFHSRSSLNQNRWSLFLICCIPSIKCSQVWGRSEWPFICEEIISWQGFEWQISESILHSVHYSCF